VALIHTAQVTASSYGLARLYDVQSDWKISTKGDHVVIRKEEVEVSFVSMFCNSAAQTKNAAKFPTLDRRIAQPKFEPRTLRTLSVLPPHRCVRLQKLSDVRLHCTAVLCRLSDFTSLLFSAVYQTSLYCCSLPFTRLHSTIVLCCLSDFTLLLFSAVYQTSLYCCSLLFIRLHSTVVLCRLSDFTLLLFSVVYQTSLYYCSLLFIRLHSTVVLCRLSDFTLLLFSVVYQTSLYYCSLLFIRLNSNAVLYCLSDFTLLLFSAVYEMPDFSR
jgi:hypothetical protein